jgi:hypothetical protein
MTLRLEILISLFLPEESADLPKFRELVLSSKGGLRYPIKGGVFDMRLVSIERDSLRLERTNVLMEKRNNIEQKKNEDMDSSVTGSISGKHKEMRRPCEPLL